MKVHIERDWSTGDYEIYIYERDRLGRLHAARPVEVVVEEIPDSQPGADVRGKVRPFLAVTDSGHGLGTDLLAALAEALANIGFKNRVEEENLTSVLKAKDAHLEDMRRLVFKESA